MKSLYKSLQVNSPVASAISWTAKINHPCNQEALAVISSWWSAIAGQQVVWDVVIGIGGRNSLTYQCFIDKTFLRDEILHYHILSHERFHFVPVKELYLDLDLQKLTVVTDSSLDVTYRISPL